MITNSSNSSASSTEPSDYEDSFQATAQERAALLPEDLLPVNLDIPEAVNTVYAAVVRLAPLREQIIEAFKAHDIGQLDRLRIYAQALSCAHIKRTRPSASSELLTRHLARATEMRDQFLMDVNALVSRGVIERYRLAELKNGNGYLNVAYDLARLVDMLKERWDAVQANSGVKQAEVDEAWKLYQLITDKNAARNQQTAAGSSANDDRTRAYTLLINAYDQTRRAVTYVRWKEHDADRILPSLWMTHHKRTFNDETDPVVPVEPVLPVGALVVPAAPPAPAGDSSRGGSPFGGN